MRIGVLTYHDGPNHGAFLQALSTLRTLQADGHDATIINYKNPGHDRMESLARLCWQRNPVAAWENFRKVMAIRRAHKVFRLGPRVSDAEAIEALGHDCIVVGSDVVWNYGIFGYDPIFFGRLNVPRLVAFAASYGSVRAEAAMPAGMSSDLAHFHAISVRDENSRAIVRNALGVDSPITSDPTIMFSCDGELRSLRNQTEHRVVVYSYRHPRQAIESLRALARESHAKTLCVGYAPRLGVRHFYDRIDLSLDPIEWMREMRDASAVMTSTFHGVVFSLKFRKPFLYVTNDKAHNRVSSLLERCGIEHSLEPGVEDEVVMFRPKYDVVSTRLAEFGERSRRWLLANVRAERASHDAS